MAPKPYSPTTPPRRKRSKTFTGCWTCRRRKVRCDGCQPRCRRCARQGLVCEGFLTRLHWMSVQMAGCETAVVETAAGSSRQRRQIPPEIPQVILSGDDIDGILGFLDSVGGRPSADVDMVVDHFGVFNPAHVRDTVVGESGFVPRDFTPNPKREGPLFDDGSGRAGMLPDGDCVAEIPASLELASLTEDPWTDLGVDLDEFLQAAYLDVEESMFIDDVDLEAFKPALQSHVHSHDDDNYKTLQLYTSPQSDVASMGQEGLLMHHYMHRVVNILCVIDNPRSPWKVIHLPRTLQSVGELNFTGTTSLILDALRKALLSTSAFYLSNDGQANDSYGLVKWAHAAIELQDQAIGLLNRAVQQEFLGRRRPKYKDFLATILSMITINTISGNTSTCRVHLEGARQLIRHMDRRKSKYSTKARALLRMYFYLRVIYESTAPYDADETLQPESCIDFGLDHDRTHTIETTGETELMVAPGTGLDMDSYELVYGIPQSLLVLLRRVTMAIRKANSARKASKATTLPAALSHECALLGAAIMDWPLAAELSRCSTLSIGPSSQQIVLHQTRAFYNALIIYFQQHIPLHRSAQLQPYVEAVLDSIETVEAIKTDLEIFGAPLGWPAFVAASEAFDPALQARFRRWYDRVEVYGIAAVRSGVNVVRQVWRRGEEGPATGTSRWRHVIERTGVHLMLT